MRRQRQVQTRLELESLEDRWTPAIGFQGGPVVAHAQVVAVYYGDYWSTSTGMQSAAQINTYLSFIVNSAFMDTMNQYGVGRGTALGVGIIDSGLSGATSVNDATIQAQLANDITISRLPGASDQHSLHRVYASQCRSVLVCRYSLLNTFGYHSALFTDHKHCQLCGNCQSGRKWHQWFADELFKPSRPPFRNNWRMRSQTPRATPGSIMPRAGRSPPRSIARATRPFSTIMSLPDSGQWSSRQRFTL